MKQITSYDVHQSQKSDFFGNSIKKYKLMLKQHFDDGYNYLCITTKKDFIKYSGSGTIWKKYLNDNPSKILTTLIFTSDNFEEFCSVCNYYSDLLQVAKSDDFLNIIPERGPVIPDMGELMHYIGSLGGKASRDRKLGIFSASKEQRSKWAIENGSKGGVKAKNEKLGFHAFNEIERKENSSKGGKIGGKIVGNLLWWTDGSTNIRSNFCPGEGFRRGMTKKIKPIPPHIKMKKENI